MSTVTLSNNWSYDRMMRLLGGMWFMLLALCVANKITYRSLAIASAEFLRNCRRSSATGSGKHTSRRGG